MEVERLVILKVKESNNKVEYEAAIYALRETNELGSTRVQLFIDSKLIASQFGGFYQAKKDRMSVYLDIVRALAE